MVTAVRRPLTNVNLLALILAQTLPVVVAPAPPITVAPAATSDAVWIALIAAIGASVAAWIQARANARLTRRNRNFVRKDAVKKGQQLQQIHVLVDGRLSAALREIAELKQAIADASPEDLVKASAALDASVEVAHKEVTDARAAGENPTAVKPADKPKGT